MSTNDSCQSLSLVTYHAVRIVCDVVILLLLVFILVLLLVKFYHHNILCIHNTFVILSH